MTGRSWSSFRRRPGFEVVLTWLNPPNPFLLYHIFMKYISLILGVALSALPPVLLAQNEKIFRGNEISESALVEALSPANPALPASPASPEVTADGPAIGKTRQIRISPVSPAPTAKAKRPAASMLITFETNSAELTSRAKQMLDVLGRALRSDKLAEYKFAIEGHADPRGDDQLNFQLSELRAAAVVKYLSENQNINPSRLTAIGKGPTELMNTRFKSFNSVICSLFGF